MQHQPTTTSAVIADYVPRLPKLPARSPEGLMLLTITEVAAQLQLSRRTVERLVARGALQVVYPVPGSVRFRPEDVAAYVAGLAARPLPVVGTARTQAAMMPRRIGMIPMNPRATKR